MIILGLKLNYEELYFNSNPTEGCCGKVIAEIQQIEHLQCS